MRLLLALILLALFTVPAQAQHNHAQGHSDYQSWASGAVSDCCTDRDCGELKDDEVRNTPSGPEILIAGQWCPVLKKHYLIRGKSPDFTVAHACVLPFEKAEPCDRLLCFVGRGGL